MCDRGGLRIPRRRGSQSSVGRRQHTNFPKNWMKFRQFWSVGGCVPGALPSPHGSATESHVKFSIGIIQIFTSHVTQKSSRNVQLNLPNMLRQAICPFILMNSLPISLNPGHLNSSHNIKRLISCHEKTEIEPNFTVTTLRLNII